jgi:hypothetical protein
MKYLLFLAVFGFSSHLFAQFEIENEEDNQVEVEEAPDVVKVVDESEFTLFQCLPARVDHNEVNNNDFHDPFKSHDIAVLDKDESEGHLEVRFAMPVRGIKPYEKTQLILNIPDIGDASSDEGVSIYYQGKKIGEVEKIEKNSVIKIDLDLRPDLNIGKTFSLMIKSNGNDGTYIYRWRSGWGVMLALYK